MTCSCLSNLPLILYLITREICCLITLFHIKHVSTYSIVHIGDDGIVQVTLKYMHIWEYCIIYTDIILMIVLQGNNVIHNSLLCPNSMSITCYTLSVFCREWNVWWLLSFYLLWFLYYLVILLICSLYLP